jgi:opacity protein-like surface antigen
MFLKLDAKMLLATLLLATGFSAFSQTGPAATEGGVPLAVGGGVSYWDVDWGHSRMEGGTLWGDYYPARVPSILHGIGLEAEARDISLNRGDKPKNFRHDTAGGGVIYAWRHYPNIYPYGKFVMGLASIDFRYPPIPTYTHDTRTYIAPGLGVQYRVYRHVWARVDYEYQFWGKFIGGTPDPQGFTVGAMYDFRRVHQR